MGSTSDLPVMEKAAEILDSFRIPFEMNALSAHRTPEEVEKFSKNAASRGIKVIIAAAGMAAHLPGVIASMTPLPKKAKASAQTRPSQTGCAGIGRIDRARERG